MPKVAIPDWTEEPDDVHPAIGARIEPYAHRILGDAAGPTRFGVHLDRPYPRAPFKET